MTCIVGYIDKENKEIVIGGDSAGTDSGFNSTVRLDTKVFIKDNRFIMGFTTSFRMGQILHYVPLRVEEQSEFEDDMAFMVKKFIPAVRAVFKENWGDMKNGGGASVGGMFLVGYKNMLYTIESDFQVGMSSRGYDAVGCGSDYALGAMHFMESMYGAHRLDAKKMITNALEAAVDFSAGCRPPFIIKSLKYE